MINAMIIDPQDNVIVAIEPLKAGDEVNYTLNGQTESLKAATDVTIYHKLARRDIAKGEPVVKYGQHIGVAACDIKAGEHVHVHNVESKREDL
ncbi:hydrolase [Gemmiger sp. An87]|uniref:UxaA family hydrolase n=1 Tax=Allofournierella sp. CML151 TaxID=2998082 RepID=UPI000B388CAF|nr:UxaA family hydrolase [Fournierella sp. CML151]OUN15232.1 hydrolase [Gemmiger sp. An87]